ncbi:MAG: NADH:ubiquinone oxidoreductase subunit 6 (subunit J) [Parasphingorhabdus sp.]|jgi:NADH:ubiquinone oxidoreductase subunit 6 (subunit J)
MAVTVLIIAVFIAIVGSLFMALFFMFKDRGKGTRTVKALSIRVGLWVVLLALIGIGVLTGVIKPSNSLNPALNKSLPANQAASE